RFSRNGLTTTYKLLYHFLKTRLMPSTHVRMISKDRALLLESIVAGHAIDMGLFINRELYACARK
ncbi:hypothetical protein, partial [Proteus mirabilis]|uniref:hypothetical protein n=1 Tax=Proteus mirabilis TaxID=584 RepID=UPI0034D5C1F2